MNIGSHHLIGAFRGKFLISPEGSALPVFSQLIAGSRGVLDFLVTYFTMFRKLIFKNEIVWCEKKKAEIFPNISTNYAIKPMRKCVL